MAAGDFPTQYTRESCKHSCAYVPDVCQFWYTIALFRPVKCTQKKYVNLQQNIQNLNKKTDQNFVFSMLKSIYSLMLVRLIDTGAFVLPSCLFVSICSLVFPNILKPTLL